jgi:Cu(I)/Ag(I) efflux system membrane fusion protein
MKKLNSILAALAILAVASSVAFFTGCKSMDSSEHGSTHVQQYTCPMHPEVVQDTPGNCPKCGMALVEKK